MWRNDSALKLQRELQANYGRIEVAAYEVLRCTGLIIDVRLEYQPGHWCVGHRQRRQVQVFGLLSPIRNLDAVDEDIALMRELPIGKRIAQHHTDLIGGLPGSGQRRDAVDLRGVVGKVGVDLPRQVSLERSLTGESALVIQLARDTADVVDAAVGGAPRVADRTPEG